VPAAAAVLPEAVKLASSVTAHIAAALGTPLLKTETTTFKLTKKGSKTTTTGFALPAWAVVAGGVVALLALQPARPGFALPTSVNTWPFVWPPRLLP